MATIVPAQETPKLPYRQGAKVTEMLCPETVMTVQAIDPDLGGPFVRVDTQADWIPGEDLRPIRRVDYVTLDGEQTHLCTLCQAELKKAGQEIDFISLNDLDDRHYCENRGCDAIQMERSAHRNAGNR